MKDLHIRKDELIIMVQRPGGEIIVPRGDTLLNPGDRAIISREINDCLLYTSDAADDVIDV